MESAAPEEPQRSSEAAKAGAITASWASLGVVILAFFLSAAANGVLAYLEDDLLTAILFVFALYGGSYFFGGRILGAERVSRRVHLSVPLAFVVTQLVLGVACLLGVCGDLLTHLLRGGLELADVSLSLEAAFDVMCWGLLFTTPLSVLLGLHIWGRRRWIARKTRA